MQAKTREARGLALSRVCVECLCVGCGVWGGGLALAVRVCRFDHDGAAWWMVDHMQTLHISIAGNVNFLFDLCSCRVSIDPIALQSELRPGPASAS